MAHAFFAIEFSMKSLRPDTPLSDDAFVPDEFLENNRHDRSLSKTQMTDRDGIQLLLREDAIAGSQAFSKHNRRIVSDPLPRKGSLTSEFAALRSRMNTRSDGTSPLQKLNLRNFTSESHINNRIPKAPVEDTPTLSPHTVTKCFQTSEKNLTQQRPSQNLANQRSESNPYGKCKGSRVSKGGSWLFSRAWVQYEQSQYSSSQSCSTPRLPIGTTRPRKLTTYPLMPHTHKMTHGHIVILPSRSLMVDLREGERRKGRRGNEVLVIDPSGEPVSLPDMFWFFILTTFIGGGLQRASSEHTVLFDRAYMHLFVCRTSTNVLETVWRCRPVDTADQA